MATHKAASSVSLLILLFFFLFAISATSQPCLISSCPGTGPSPIISFPFRLRRHQPRRCGFPGFDLKCNKLTQTILTLPHSGDFQVREINYVSQTLQITDPDNCLPNRFLNFSLLGSPFRVNTYQNYTFLNCSSDAEIPVPVKRFRCLAGDGYSVVMLEETGYSDRYNSTRSCEFMRTVRVPQPWLYWSEGYSVIQMSWSHPSCETCAVKGQACGFKNASALDVGCFSFPSTSNTGDEATLGFPRIAKYGIIIGVGVPALLCVIEVSSCLCRKIKCFWRQRGDSSIELSSSAVPPPIPTVLGLDESTIGKYPKFVLGQSKRLPKPSYNTCPICLSEYQPKEALRTLPLCNHYFHVQCIDEWLKMNGSCPLCRNWPGHSPPQASPLLSSSPSTTTLLSSR